MLLMVINSITAYVKYSCAEVKNTQKPACFLLPHIMDIFSRDRHG